MKKIIIIGAGITGLSCGIFLLKKGEVIVTDVKLEHPLNASFPIVLTPEPIVSVPLESDDAEQQFSNAFAPISSTLVGMFTEVKPVFLNALA